MDLSTRNELVLFLKNMCEYYSIAYSNVAQECSNQAMFNLFSADSNKIVFFLPIDEMTSSILKEEMFHSTVSPEIFKKINGNLNIAADLLDYKESKGNHVKNIEVLLQTKFRSEINEGCALVLRLIGYYLENYSKKNLVYCNNFLGSNPNRIEYPLSVASANGVNFIRIETDANLFLEHFVFYLIIRYPIECKWVKTNGAVGPIYRHHLIVFNNWIMIEQDAISKINFSLFNNNGDRNYILLENIKNSGINISDVFIRAVSRYTFRESEPYLLLRNNCEHFGRFCLYGSPASVQFHRFIVGSIFIITLSIHMNYKYIVNLSFLFVLIAFIFEFIFFCVWKKEFKFTMFREYFLTFFKFPK